MVRNYITTVKIKGVFTNDKGISWSSRLCWVKVVYKLKRNKIGILKVYRQKAKNNDTYIYPKFKDDFKSELLKRAQWNYEAFILKKHKLREKTISDKKHHLEDKCERCVELGHYCKQ
mgnify:FL=1